MPLGNAYTTISLSVSNISLSLSANPKYASPGDTVTFTVTETVDGNPASGRSIRVQISPDGVNWYDVCTATTGSDGKGTCTWTVDWYVSGVKLPCRYIKARAVDPMWFVVSSPIDMAIYYRTKFSEAYTDKPRYAPGETVTVTARLVYTDDTGDKPVVGKTVTFTLKDSTGTIIDSKQVTTDSYGYAKAQFTAPSKSGNYTIDVYFGGATSLGAELSPASVFTGLSVSEPVATAVKLAVLAGLGYLMYRLLLRG